ncbi:MAG: shikimate dehydrogenase [Sphaerochaetaceae bacterium]
MNKSYELLCQEAVMHGPLESLFCCIGDPVIGNPTQLMMEATFRSMLFPARYLTCTVTSANVERAIDGIKALGFSGANVTAPHKVAVIPFLDGLTESARLSGAVNCIIKQEGKYIGDNTDGKGFLTSIELIRPVAGMHVLVIGAGGAARAIITELALHGASTITIANRTVEKAQDIIDRVGPHVKTTFTKEAFTGTYTIGAQYDLVVQATSVGLFDPDKGFDLVWEPKEKGSRIAADVVFNPVHTQFLASAEKAGATTVDGLGMLVFQGAIAVTHWTGKEANCESMRKAMEEAFTI